MSCRDFIAISTLKTKNTQVSDCRIVGNSEGDYPSKKTLIPDLLLMTLSMSSERGFMIEIW